MILGKRKDTIYDLLRLGIGGHDDFNLRLAGTLLLVRVLPPAQIVNDANRICAGFVDLDIGVQGKRRVVALLRLQLRTVRDSAHAQAGGRWIRIAQRLAVLVLGRHLEAQRPNSAAVVAAEVHLERLVARVLHAIMQQDQLAHEELRLVQFHRDVYGFGNGNRLMVILLRIAR